MLPFAIPAALSRVPWKLLGVALLVAVILVQSLRLERAERRADREHAHAASLQSQLDTLAAKSKAQQKETAKRIQDIVKRDDSEAKRIESAPLPGNCRTPSEVLQADL